MYIEYHLNTLVLKKVVQVHFDCFVILIFLEPRAFGYVFGIVGKVLMNGRVMRSFIIFKLSTQELLNIPIMIKNIVNIQCVIQISMLKVEIPWILMPKSKNYHKFPI
jgi:hypothetical protein